MVTKKDRGRLLSQSHSAGGYHTSALSCTPRCFVRDGAMVPWLMDLQRGKSKLCLRAASHLKNSRINGERKKVATECYTTATQASAEVAAWLPTSLSTTLPQIKKEPSRTHHFFLDFAQWIPVVGVSRSNEKTASETRNQFLENLHHLALNAQYVSLAQA